MTVCSGLELLNYKPHGMPFVFCLDISGGQIDLADSYCRVLQRHGLPAFFSSTPRSVQRAHGLEYFFNMVCFLRKKYNVNITPHIDHAKDIDFLNEALKVGFRSIMFDGSDLNLEDNIKITKKVKAQCRDLGASLEGEVGVIGGREGCDIDRESKNPTISECMLFCGETEVDFFAPAFGNQHGAQSGVSNFDWTFLSKLKDFKQSNLVLHGSSGIDKNTFGRLLMVPFVKVNFATDLRNSFVSGMSMAMENLGGGGKPNEILRASGQASERFLESIICQLAVNI